MKIREILEDSLLIVRFSVYSCRDCLNFLISELDCSKKQSKIKMAMLIANIPVRDLHVKCKEFDNPRLYRVHSHLILIILWLHMFLWLTRKDIFPIFLYQERNFLIRQRNIWNVYLSNTENVNSFFTYWLFWKMYQAWEEVWSWDNEGSYVFKHKELYYMAYSGNSFESPFYGVGCATATDIIGKWTKYDENLILQNPGAFAGCRV